MTSTKKKSDEQKRIPLANITDHKQNAYPKQTCDIQNFRKEHPFLSKLLPDNGIIFECGAQAPSPSKDYGQLEITTDKVILRWWKITLRNLEDAKYPGEIKDSYEDFYHDEIAQREIWRIFGQSTLDYCLNLIQGKFDWLARMPPKIQTKILSYVNLDDIPQISLVSKDIRALCRENDLWKLYYIRHYGKHALDNKDLIHFAERRGWRHVFFTNRLKLQMQLRREAQLERHHPEDPSDLLRSRERRSHIQPSPPTTPRTQQQQQQQRFNEPQIRRHSFAIRKEPARLSPRALSQLDRQEFFTSPRSVNEDVSEMGRLSSPSSSVRSHAGSMSSAASALPPTHRKNRHE